MTQAPETSPQPDPDVRTSLLRDLEAWSRTPMLVLSGVWLILLVVEFTRGESRALAVLGTAIWVVFILEFAVRLMLAPRRLSFLASNWLTVLSLLLPALRLLRVLRVLRAARAVRALRGLRLVRLVGGANRGMNSLRAAMKRRGLGYVLALTLLVTLLGAAGMQALEGGATPAFSNFGDALWWTAMIMTTMGSEGWPQTVEGRMLCVGLSLYAFAVFGYITAAFASFFVDRDRQDSAAPGADDLQALRAEIAGLRLAISAAPPGR